MMSKNEHKLQKKNIGQVGGNLLRDSKSFMRVIYFARFLQHLKIA